MGLPEAFAEGDLPAVIGRLEHRGEYQRFQSVLVTDRKNRNDRCVGVARGDTRENPTWRVDEVTCSWEDAEIFAPMNDG